jgi:heptosyltransferase-2
MDDKHPEIYVSKETQSWVETKFKEKKITEKDFTVIFSVVSQSHPTWFKERFALLADKLIEKYKAKIVFVGTNKEKKFIYDVKRLMKSRRNHYWFGQTTIQGLFALINNSKMVVGIDSSPTNIAAAFKIPVVALFGAGDRTIWHPFNKNSISIQRKHEVCTACMKSFCKFKNHRYLECMKSITVNDVLRAVERLK